MNLGISGTHSGLAVLWTSVVDVISGPTSGLRSGLFKHSDASRPPLIDHCPF